MQTGHYKISEVHTCLNLRKITILSPRTENSSSEIFRTSHVFIQINKVNPVLHRTFLRLKCFQKRHVSGSFTAQYGGGRTTEKNQNLSVILFLSP